MRDDDDDELRTTEPKSVLYGFGNRRKGVILGMRWMSQTDGGTHAAWPEMDGWLFNFGAMRDP